MMFLCIKTSWIIGFARLHVLGSVSLRKDSFSSDLPKSNTQTDCPHQKKTYCPVDCRCSHWSKPKDSDMQINRFLLCEIPRYLGVRTSHLPSFCEPICKHGMIPLTVPRLDPHKTHWSWNTSVIKTVKKPVEVLIWPTKSSSIELHQQPRVQNSCLLTWNAILRPNQMKVEQRKPTEENASKELQAFPYIRVQLVQPSQQKASMSINEQVTPWKKDIRRRYFAS